MQLAEAVTDAERQAVVRKLASQLFISAPELAILLQVDRRTVYKALELGEIPGFKVGTFWRIPTTWLRARLGLEPGLAPQDAVSAEHLRIRQMLRGGDDAA